MTMHDATFSRRSLLKAGAGLAIGAYIARSGKAFAQTPPAASYNIAPNTFLIIKPDNTVTVLCKNIEFGQGPFTGLATLVAEELDADWSQMRADHAPSNPVALQEPCCSACRAPAVPAPSPIRTMQMRQGRRRRARQMLVAAAADSWQVPASEITVRRRGHPARFRRRKAVSANSPTRPCCCRSPSDPKLKDPSTFRLIGKEGVVKRLDSAVKSNGTAEYTLDINEPDMLTVVIARSPGSAARWLSFDAAAAKAIPGVVDVKQVPTGIAVYAKGFWPAKTGADALKISWDDSKAEKRSSEQLLSEYPGAVENRPARSSSSRAMPRRSIAKGGRIVEAEYVFPVSGPCADGAARTASSNGTATEPLRGSAASFQTPDHAVIAKVLGIGMEKVQLQTMLAGGSFGRRAQQTTHVALELAEVAKAIGPGKPIKLVWTREDDMRGGYYRPFRCPPHARRGARRQDRGAGPTPSSASRS